jgi:hypothetical protein
MNIFIRDLKGGLAIVRSAQVAVAVFVLFATGVELASEALASSLLSTGLPAFPFGPVWLAPVLASWVLPLVTAFVLVLFMIEIAAIGADRLAGREARMHLVFRGRVAWALFLACVFSLLIFLLLSWLLTAFQGVIFASIMGDALRQGGGSDSGELEGTFSTIQIVGAFNHLLGLVALAFGVSRFALIPLIVRQRDVSFGEAWTIQTHGFDNYYGSVRNRFFRVFLALLVLESLFALVAGQVTTSDLLLTLIVYPVGILLVTVVPVGILTHMVLHPPERPADGAADTTDQRYGQAPAEGHHD